MTRFRELVRALVITTLTASSMVGTADAAAGVPAPAAAIQISTSGKIGRFDTAIVTMHQRCRASAVVAELVVDVSQPGVSGTRAGTFGAVCDGTWHRVQVEVSASGGAPFVAGGADVFARFTVLDGNSMDPLPQATASARVTLLPSAELNVGQEAHVGRFGAVVVPVAYRCQRPWLVSGLSVDVDLNGFGGSGSLDSGLRCDASWQHIEVGVSADTGRPFEPGFAHIDARLDIQDPSNFDPVEQAVDTARVWVAPAARILVVSAKLAKDTSVTVVIKARCHRPFLVAQWGVHVTERNASVAGQSFRRSGLACDARWHTLKLRVVSPQHFVAGFAVVDAVLDIQDPVDFDPVDQATDRRTLRLAAPE